MQGNTTNGTILHESSANSTASISPALLTATVTATSPTPTVTTAAVTRKITISTAGVISLPPFGLQASETEIAEITTNPDFRQLVMSFASLILHRKKPTKPYPINQIAAICYNHQVTVHDTCIMPLSLQQYTASKVADEVLKCLLLDKRFIFSNTHTIDNVSVLYVAMHYKGEREGLVNLSTATSGSGGSPKSCSDCSPKAAAAAAADK